MHDGKCPGLPASRSSYTSSLTACPPLANRGRNGSQTVIGREPRKNISSSCGIITTWVRSPAAMRKNRVCSKGCGILRERKKTVVFLTRAFLLSQVLRSEFRNPLYLHMGSQPQSAVGAYLTGVRILKLLVVQMFYFGLPRLLVTPNKTQLQFSFSFLAKSDEASQLPSSQLQLTSVT